MANEPRAFGQANLIEPAVAVLVDFMRNDWPYRRESARALAEHFDLVMLVRPAEAAAIADEIIRTLRPMH
jgi:hypothetical protein